LRNGGKAPVVQHGDAAAVVDEEIDFHLGGKRGERKGASGKGVAALRKFRHSITPSYLFLLFFFIFSLTAWVQFSKKDPALSNLRQIPPMPYDRQQSLTNR
jgi:hypothetical protein